MTFGLLDLTLGRDEHRVGVVAEARYQPTATNLTSDYTVVVEVDGVRFGRPVGPAYWGRVRAGDRVSLNRRTGRWTGISDIWTIGEPIR